MSSSDPVLDPRITRQTTYIHGRALVDTATSEYRAHQRAGTFSRHFRPDDTGLEFRHEPIGHLPNTWGIYAYPITFLSRRGPDTLPGTPAWSDDSVSRLLGLLDTWGSPVLVRTFSSSGTTRSVVHRDNTDTKAKFPALSRVRFRSQTMGLHRHAYGQFAYLEEADNGDE